VEQKAWSVLVFVLAADGLGDELVSCELCRGGSSDNSFLRSTSCLGVTTRSQSDSSADSEGSVVIYSSSQISFLCGGVVFATVELEAGCGGASFAVVEERIVLTCFLGKSNVEDCNCDGSSASLFREGTACREGDVLLVGT
jgi:hypothetical protein